MVRRLLAAVACALFVAEAGAQTPLPPPTGNGFLNPIFAPAPAPGETFAKDPIFGVPQGMPVQKEFPSADGGLFPQPDVPPPKLWKGSFEAGANGATGNTETLNARLFWTADRKTDTNLFHADMTYLLGTQNGNTIQNTAILNMRDEILFPGSRWSLYGTAFYDYDELRDYRSIIGVYGGLGYLVCDTESVMFKVRGGAGSTYKTGGPPDIWEPSLNFGYDFKWKLGERSAFISTCDYYPTFNDFGDYLLRLRAAYEVTLDPCTGCFFRIGIFERYDSNPGPGFLRSDLNYFTALGFNF